MEARNFLMTHHWRMSRADKRGNFAGISITMYVGQTWRMADSGVADERGNLLSF